MISMVRRVVGRLLEPHRARGRYFAADRAAGRALARLSIETEAFDRMVTLNEIAGYERVIAENVCGFGDAADRDEDGFTLTASSDLAARMVALVADTEASVAFRGTGNGTDNTVALFVPPMPVPGGAEDVLARLRCEPRPLQRAWLTLELYDALVDMAGGQACEVLASLARAYYQVAGLSWSDAAARLWQHSNSRRGER